MVVEAAVTLMVWHAGVPRYFEREEERCSLGCPLCFVFDFGGQGVGNYFVIVLFSQASVPWPNVHNITFPICNY